MLKREHDDTYISVYISLQSASTRHQEVGVGKTAHDPESLCVLGKLRVHADSQGNICHGAGGEDGDLAGIFFDLLNHPSGG